MNCGRACKTVQHKRRNSFKKFRITTSKTSLTILAAVILVRLRRLTTITSESFVYWIQNLAALFGGFWPSWMPTPNRDSSLKMAFLHTAFSGYRSRSTYSGRSKNPGARMLRQSVRIVKGLHSSPNHCSAIWHVVANCLIELVVWSAFLDFCVDPVAKYTVQFRRIAKQNLW